MTMTAMGTTVRVAEWKGVQAVGEALAVSHPSGENLGELAHDARLPSGAPCLAVSPPDGTAVLVLVAPKPRSEEYRLIGRPTQIAFLTENVRRKYEEVATLADQIEIGNERAHETRLAHPRRQRKAQRGKIALEILDRGIGGADRGERKRGVCAFAECYPVQYVGQNFERGGLRRPQ